MAPEVTTFPLDGPIAVQVRLVRGAVRVEAHDGLTDATVRLSGRSGAEHAAERITVELRAGTLVVTEPHQERLSDFLGGWRHERGGVDAVITVPTGTPLTIATGCDEIVLTGRCGDAEVTTGSGRISIDTVAGDLRLRCGHGDGHINAVDGATLLSVGSGSCHLGRAGGRLTAKLGRGDLQVDTAEGELHARTGYGALRLGAVHADLDLATGYGPIVIGVPSGVSARVDAATGYGRVRSDVPVEAGPRPGGQPITVRARTGWGDISLRSAAVVAA